VKVLVDTDEECQQWMLIMQDAIFYRNLIAGEEAALQKFERQTSGVADSDLGSWLKEEGLDEGIGVALESLGARSSQDVTTMSNEKLRSIRLKPVQRRQLMAVIEKARQQEEAEEKEIEQEVRKIHAGRQAEAVCVPSIHGESNSAIPWS
jgi:hypothetical protein